MKLIRLVLKYAFLPALVVLFSGPVFAGKLWSNMEMGVVAAFPGEPQRINAASLKHDAIGYYYSEYLGDDAINYIIKSLPTDGITNSNYRKALQSISKTSANSMPGHLQNYSVRWGDFGENAEAMEYEYSVDMEKVVIKVKGFMVFQYGKLIDANAQIFSLSGKNYDRKAEKYLESVTIYGD